MRNLLEESMEVTTIGIVVVKVQLSDGIYRIYQIHRNSLVGRTDLQHTHYHSILGITINNNVDYWSKECGKKYMSYKDDASFAKAIQAIQKRIK
jgi:hypothetical protein